MFGLAILSALISFAAASTIPGVRIVGGRNASIEEFPYIVAVERQYQTCDGVIISKRHILSSATCFSEEDNPNRIDIRIGSSLLEHGGKIVRPLKITRHPKAGISTDFDYDIAVLELENDIELSETAQIIKIADSEPTVGDQGLISGWGSQEVGGDPPRVLQAATVAVVDHQKCKESFSGYIPVTDRMFCAAGEGTGACFGDSGGPFVVETKSGEKVLAGVISWYYKTCNRPGYYDIYVNLNHPEIRSFIQEQVGV